MYITKNEQQLRWAFVFNQALWLIHDIYIQAYPAAAMALALGIWTLVHIFRNRNNYKR